MENMNSVLEGIVKELQDNDGHKKVTTLDGWNSSTWGAVSKKLAHYGLANYDPTDGTVTLTKYGWEFESFEKEREEKQLQNDLITSNLSAAKSTSQLSANTATFYEKQSSFLDKQDTFNNTYKNLTIAIFVAAAISAIAAVAPLFRKSETPYKDLQDKLQTMQTKVQQLEQNQQSQLKTGSPVVKEEKKNDKSPKDSGAH